MRFFRKFLLYLILFVAIIFGILYVAVNSSYLFDKAAGYFAPQYEIHYDKVSGNALTGITVDGLYYKNKKLARQVKVKLNPVTLLEKKITVSHLTLHGVNEQYLEEMISDFSDDEDNSSSSFPFSLRLNDVRLTMLPFYMEKIRFVQADLKVESIDYAEDDFAFGTLRLLAKTSLGRADIKGQYHGRNLHLSDLYIGNLNTTEIERLFLDENSTTTEEGNKTTDESPSIFVPQKLFVKRLKATVLPRSYQGVSLSLLTIDGKEVAVDLDQHTATGALALVLRTDVANADMDLLASAEQLQFRKMTIEDINLTKLLTILSSEENSSDTTAKAEVKQEAAFDIPFVPDHILVDSLNAALLPTVQAGIPISQTQLQAKSLEVDLPHKLLQKGNVRLDLQSQIATLVHEGNITDNRLVSHIEIVPKEKLFTRYHLPLRQKAVKKISIDAVTDKTELRASMAFSAKQLLDAKKDAFNLSIKPSLLHVTYRFETGELEGDLDANVSTPYTENSQIRLRFGQKDGFGFKGELSPGAVEGIDPKFSTLLQGLTVDFDGDLKDMIATLESTKLKGKITLKDFATGTVHIESKDALAVGELIKLPEALKKSRAKLAIDMPIDTNQTLPLHAKATLLSNVLNMDANVRYDGNVSLKATATIPPKSLLNNFDKNIHLKALSPLQVDATLKGDALQAKLSTKALKVAAEYDMKSGKTKGDINLAGTHLKVSGVSSKTLALNLGSRSIQSLLKAVNSIYKIDLPELGGSVDLQATVKDLKSLSLSMHSKEIRIGKGRKEATTLSNLSLKATGDAKGVVLQSYAVETQGVKLYANKSSKVTLDGDRLLLSPFWLNDALKATGSYDLKKKKGKITADASALKIDHEMADIIAALGLETRINGDKISVNGKVHLKGGTIKYDLNSKSFAADSDIIILQRQHKKSNYFQNNIALQMSLDSSKPLIYKKGDIDIALQPDIRASKRFGGNLKVHGKVLLLPGGSYTFEGKRFVLQKSSITFKGKPTAPILNITIVYRHTGTTIRVKVSGTASDPSLHFSSDPHMSREEILSFIMFDTGSGGNENKAGDVTNLVAGSLVKSLFANMGLKLDHLVLTGAGFEVGKKLSDKITVIYDQQKESSIKLRIQNTKSIETDISFGASSRSADIFYKREF